MRLSKLHFFNQNYEKSKSCLSMLEKSYPDIDLNDEYVVLKFNVLFLAGETQKAQVLLERAVTAEWPEDKRRILLYYLGKIYFWNGDHLKANHLLQCCYHYYISIADHYMIGSVLYMLGYIAFQRSYFDISESYYRKALLNFNASGKTNELRKTHHMLGILAYRTGRYEEAKVNLVAARECSKKGDNIIGIINSDIALARLSLFYGDYEHAGALLTTAYGKSNELGYKRQLALSAEFLGESWYHRGNYNESLNCLRKAELLARDISPRGDIAVEVYRRLGDVYLALGRIEEAEHALSEAQDIAKYLNDWYELGAVFRAFGILALQKRDIDLARAYFTESIATLKLIKESFELARTYITAAETIMDWLNMNEIDGALSSEILNDSRDYATEATHLYYTLGLDRRARESEGVLRRFERNSRDASDQSHVWQLCFDPMWLIEGSVVARSRHMRGAISKVKWIAPTTLSILVTGETGTGKEVIAKLIHRWSDRPSGPFVAVNCASVPGTIFESELFGHRRGAFTGAERDHRGLIERASGGTLFLDEISELSSGQQAKLLRVLQEGMVRRVGETKERPVDVRVIAATNEDVDALLRSGRLREDFYHRIAAESINLKPLRERRDDIPALFVYYLESSGESFRVERGVIELFERYHWPGNVRELENVTRVLAVLGRADRVVRLRDLPLKIRDYAAYEHGRASRNAVRARRGPCVSSACREADPDGVRRLIASSLCRNRGNRSAAARDLGISRRTLYRRMSELGLTEK